MRPALLSLLLLASPAFAGDPPPGVTIYPAAYFAGSGASDAADMIARVPGFTLVDADDEVRGYAGAQGNVLIDGARPASKRESLDDVLGRIPAHAVERIEVIRAGAAGYDLLGRAMIANVVRKPQTVTEASVEAGVLADGDGGVQPSLELEAAREWGDRSLEVAAASEPELDDETGDGQRATHAPDGELLEAADSDVRRTQRLSHVTANWGQPLAGGTLGGFAALRDTRERESGTVLATFPEAARETAEEKETLQEVEASLRYAREIDDRTTLEALASQRTGWLDVRSEETEDDERETFAQGTRSSESIVRLELRQARTPRLGLNGALEVAVNSLDGDATLVEDDELVELPGSRVRIEERRGEASFGAQWQAADAWRVESGLDVETSTIRQTGDSPLERDFVYWKPRLAARWERGEREHWRLSVGREVGQLAFEDFVASASLDDDVVSAGNARLEPDKTWRTVLAWERGFGRDGAFSLTLAHDEIADVVDRVPVFDGEDVFDAPGNIGDGKRDSLALELGTSLDALGWPTLRLDATVLWQTSRVTDPTTGQARRISEEKPLEGEIGLTQTLAPRGLKWGVEVDLAEREEEFRHDEVSLERADASLELFVEQKFGDGWRWRAELVDPFGRDLEELRERLDETETRRHRAPAQLLLTLRREMGG